jgi:hypothetical protein
MRQDEWIVVDVDNAAIWCGHLGYLMGVVEDGQA